MYRIYPDLRARLGEPYWHDDNGVPRYVHFHPSLCGIYDTHVALLQVRCQGCGQMFIVSASWDHSDDMYKLLLAQAAGVSCDLGPMLPTSDNDGGSFMFGDAPWHGDEQCNGTTMTTDTLRVVEFWIRDLTHAFDWQRRPEFEFAYEGPDST